jgi:hypothetical protein
MSLAPTLEKKWYQMQKGWARPGFEPGTSRTRNENHTPRPTSRDENHFCSNNCMNIKDKDTNPNDAYLDAIIIVVLLQQFTFMLYDTETQNL